MPALSYLYVPGDRPDRLARAHLRGADAVIADLEDSVHPAHEEQARHDVAAWVGRGDHDGVEGWVRIGSGAAEVRDVEAVVRPGLTGLCVPKVDGPQDAVRVHELVSAAEARTGMAPGSVVLCPLIESGAGLLAAAEIARTPRVRMLQIGEVDLAAGLRLRDDGSGAALTFARGFVVAASAAAGIAAPLGAVSTDLADMEAFRRSTEALRSWGFRGRACIHPDQVVIVNESFRPTQAEVDDARTVVTVAAEAAARGEGVGRTPAGVMVDEAVVRIAREILGAGRGISDRED